MAIGAFEKLKDFTKQIPPAITGAGLGSMLGMGQSGTAIGGLSGLFFPRETEEAMSNIKNIGKDLMFGKEQTVDDVDPDIRKTQAQARAAQRAGLTRLGQDFETDPRKIALADVKKESRLATGRAEDAKRRIRQLIAKRGLSNTSLGLGQQIGAEQLAAQQVGEIQASLPERVRQLRLQQAQGLLQAGSSVLGQPGLNMPITQERQGGLAELLGLGAGAALGGVQGAQIGLGAGQIARSRLS